MCTLLTEGFFSAVDVCKGRRCEERAHCAKNVTILTFGASQECGNLPCLSLFLSCVFRCHCVLTFPNCPAWCLLSSRNVCFCALQLTASAWTPSLCHFSASGLEPRSGPLLRCWAGAATQVWCQWPFFFYISIISVIHHHLVFFLRPKIEVTARVRWTGPKPTTPPFTSPTSSPSSSSAFSSPWWSCSSPTSPS